MAERQTGYRKASLVLFAGFAVVKWRSRSVAKSAYLYSLRTKLTFHDANTGFPAGNDVCGTSTEMTSHYPDLGSASDLVKQIFNQSGALSRSSSWRVNSMEFLHSFLRRHFATKRCIGGVTKCIILYVPATCWDRLNQNHWPHMSKIAELVIVLKKCSWQPTFAIGSFFKFCVIWNLCFIDNFQLL